jgi:hypothetical protein
MKPSEAWLRISTLLILSTLAFYAPQLILIWIIGAIAFDARFGMGQLHKTFLAFLVITVLLNGILLAWVSPGVGATIDLGALSLGWDGAVRGIVGGLRISAIIGVNLAWLEETNVAAVLDGLQLPHGATVFLAAIFIAVQDIGRDFRDLVEGRQMAGEWPRGKLARLTATAGLITPLLVASVGRARVRRDALQVARITVSKNFVPIVALTAVAVAGRMALVAVPNISLVHVVVFVGGLVFGTRIAMLAAMFAMIISNLLLSGFVPTSFVNVPAMMVVGLIGGTLRQVKFNDRPGRVLAFIVGLVATLAFSIVADVSEWLLVPEFRGDVAYLQVRILAGLAFNVIPAFVHGALFALVAGPVQRAFTSGRTTPAEFPRSPINPTRHP